MTEVKQVADISQVPFDELVESASALIAEIERRKKIQEEEEEAKKWPLQYTTYVHGDDESEYNMLARVPLPH